MRVLVCGGRDFFDYKFVRTYLQERFEMNATTTIIHGGARGADWCAKQVAKEFNLDCMEYKAHWRRYALKAGPIRNARMLTDGRPDIVVAFPGGKGTAHMIQQATAAGVPVEVVSYP